MHRGVVGLLLTLAAPVAASAQAQDSANPVAIVREYIAAQNRGDVDRMLSLLADRVEIRFGLTDARLASSASSENQGELRQRFTRIVQGFPGARSEILEVISDGSVVMTKERTSGLPGGGSDTGLAMYRVQNGKIHTLWAVSSNAAAGND